MIEPMPAMVPTDTVATDKVPSASGEFTVFADVLLSLAYDVAEDVVLAENQEKGDGLADTGHETEGEAPAETAVVSRPARISLLDSEPIVTLRPPEDPKPTPDPAVTTAAADDEKPAQEAREARRATIEPKALPEALILRGVTRAPVDHEPRITPPVIDLQAQQAQSAPIATPKSTATPAPTLAVPEMVDQQEPRSLSAEPRLAEPAPESIPAEQPAPREKPVVAPERPPLPPDRAPAGPRPAPPERGDDVAVRPARRHPITDRPERTNGDGRPVIDPPSDGPKLEPGDGPRPTRLRMPSAVRLAERIEMWVRRSENMPPPRVMTLRGPEMEGLMIRVAMQSDGLSIVIHNSTADDAVWIRQLGEQLNERGFDLAELTEQDEQGERRPIWDDDKARHRRKERFRLHPDAETGDAA